MECLPESLKGTRFYQPTDRGMEQRIAQRLAELRAKRDPGDDGSS
jgi:putative ATPase